MVYTATSNKRSLIDTSSHAQSASVLRWRRRLSRCRYGILCLLVITSFAAATGCGSEEPGERYGDDEFQTAVASNRNYDVYWLGPGFHAGNFEFEGPHANEPDVIDNVERGGLVTYYEIPVGMCCASLELVLYSRPAWDYIQEVRKDTRFARLEPRDVVVGGFPAKLRTILRPEGGLVAHVLMVDFGDTVVEATTSASVPATLGGPQSNPLTDVTAFLAVMQNLRPYPE